MALEKEINRKGVGGTSSTLSKLISLYKLVTRFLYLNRRIFFHAEGEGFTIREILARLK